ncbi:MAG TPA: nitroreductase/quinone reductase family protein [Acidimicrobiales bacterium]|nr:nitroreductase/quinone reductase family protein [Acidimicrobiales bacterium]
MAASETLGLERKRRIVRAVERYLQNPPIRLLLRVGLPIPIFALVETVGRRTGRPRQNPVINGLDGDKFWIIAEHGRAAGYVKNLVADPRVRIKVRRHWRTGLATIMDDDAMERARWMRTTLGRRHFADVWAARTFGTEPLTIRVDFDPL